MPLSPEKVAALALEQLAYWEKLQNGGQVIYTAPFVGKRARVAVYRVDSTGELLDLLNADPLFFFMDRDVVPLADNDHLRAIYEGRRDVTRDSER